MIARTSDKPPFCLAAVASYRQALGTLGSPAPSYMLCFRSRTRTQSPHSSRLLRHKDLNLFLAPSCYRRKFRVQHSDITPLIYPLFWPRPSRNSLHSVGPRPSFSATRMMRRLSAQKINKYEPSTFGRHLGAVPYLHSSQGNPPTCFYITVSLAQPEFFALS